jgi:hypothetical protein
MEVAKLLKSALEAEDLVLGGGNARKLKALPASARHVDNANAFVGGFRLWNRISSRKKKQTPSMHVSRGRVFLA